MKGEEEKKKEDRNSLYVKIGGRHKHLLSSLIQKLITGHFIYQLEKGIHCFILNVSQLLHISLFRVHCKKFASYNHPFSLQEKMIPFGSLGLDEFGGHISGKQGNLEL